MRICDLQTARIQVSHAAKRLREQWAVTEEHWRDSNCEAFRQLYLQPLTPQVTLLMAAVQQLADVLEQAERECSDEECSEG